MCAQATAWYFSLKQILSPDSSIGRWWLARETARRGILFRRNITPCHNLITLQPENGRIKQLALWNPWMPRHHTGTSKSMSLQHWDWDSFVSTYSNFFHGSIHSSKNKKFMLNEVTKWNAWNFSIIFGMQNSYEPTSFHFIPKLWQISRSFHQL